MIPVSRSSLALVAFVSLLACNQPQAEMDQCDETPTHPSQTTPVTTATPTQSLTVSSVDISVAD